MTDYNLLLEQELYRVKLIGEVVENTRQVFEKYGIDNKLRNGKCANFVAQVLMNQIGGLLGVFESEDPVFPTNYRQDDEIYQEIILTCHGRHVEVRKALEFDVWFKQVANKLKEMKATEFQIKKHVADIYVEFSTSLKINKTVRIPLDLYNKLVSDLKRNGFHDETVQDVLIYRVFLRYVYVLNSGNDQLGIPYYHDVKEKFPVEAELFASPLNHSLDRFCSLFYDTDQPFGSLGSIFNHLPFIKEKKVYFSNPPFHNGVMSLAVSHMLKALEKVKTTIVVILPVWDWSGLCQLQYTRTAEKYKNEDFVALTLLEKSEFFRCKILIPKEKHPYFDHNLRLFVDASPTYTVIISSDDCDLSPLKEYLTKVNDSSIDISQLCSSPKRHYQYLERQLKVLPLPSTFYQSKTFLEAYPEFEKLVYRKPKHFKNRSTGHSDYKYSNHL